MDSWSTLLSNPLAALVPPLVAVALVSFVAVSAIFFIWLERKVAGRIQDRLGPTRVGGKFGWLQTLADGIKLLAKEDIIPASADRFLFRLGPYIAFVGSFLGFIALPFAATAVAVEMNVAVFFILAVLSTEVFGVILGGYGSGSKWSLFGGMREAAQVVSYEVPMAIAVVIVVLAAGSMNMVVIAQQQEGLFWNWYIFRDPFIFLTFWVYFTCAMASCKRAPFDLAEAESELVAGFHTEYSGLRWSFWFMAEYGSMFAVSGIAITLFLGGWNSGFLWFDLAGPLGIIGTVINVFVFIVKCWLLVFVMMWVRWTLPRLRIDQVMMTCLKYLLPMSCALLLGASLFPLLWNTFLPGVRIPRNHAGYPQFNTFSKDREANRAAGDRSPDFLVALENRDIEQTFIGKSKAEVMDIVGAPPGKYCDFEVIEIIEPSLLRTDTEECKWLTNSAILSVEIKDGICVEAKIRGWVPSR